MIGFVALTGAAAVGVTDLEALRGPLAAYAYRMLGAAADADDAAQEALIRALRDLDSYDPERGSLSTWVHAIATNVCLDMLRGARRRALAWDLVPASAYPDLGAPLPPDRWVEPMPDSRLLDGCDPAELAVRRESVRLAFVVALQALAPRQRAVLILRDVLAFTAVETAQMLDTSAAAANSALQRARRTLETYRLTASRSPEAVSTVRHELLSKYIDAFEAHDVDRLTALLCDDARSAMPPFTWWLQGRETIGAAMAAGGGCVGDRLIPGAGANGCLSLGQYRPSPEGVLRPFALIVLELRDGAVADVVTFLGVADRFAEFGLPEILGDELTGDR
jgi:RNA polymerase sigma-70 factor (ECF subfamily)